MSILKYTGKYLLIGTLCLIFLFGTFLFVTRSRDTVEHNEQIITDGEQNDASGVQRGHVHRSSKPPPPGETDKTGHWDGNVWHKTTPVQVKTSRSSGKSSRVHFDLDDESVALARRIIRDRPYSEDALKARLFLAEYDENEWTDDTTRLVRLHEALIYHPESPRLLIELGILTRRASPEEAIGYAHKALKHLPSDWDGASIYGDVLAVAYQRLGDSKTAMMYLEKAQKLVRARPPRTGHIDMELDDYSFEIEALTSGTWWVQPMEVPDSEESTFSSVPHASVLESTSPIVEDNSNVSLDNMLEEPSSEDVSVPSLSDIFPFLPSDVDRVMASMHQMVLDLDREVLEDETRHREYQDFVEWTGSLLKASPNNSAAFTKTLQEYLLRFQSGKTGGSVEKGTSSDRVRRASSLLRRLGPASGYSELRKVDPELADQLRRSAPPKREPPLRRGVPQKKEHSK